MFGVFATIGLKEGLILFYLRSKVSLLQEHEGTNPHKFTNIA